MIAIDRTSGLDTDSFVMVDKVTAVRRSSIGNQLGRLESIQMVELERRLIAFLGLAR